MSVSADLINWKTQNQITPIILTGGIATAQGGGLPIVALTNPDVSGIEATTQGAVVDGSLAGTYIDAQADGFNANFCLMQGSTLLDYEIAMYPFANQAVAANALIAQPLRISMSMLIPASGDFPYSQKRNVLILLQNTLAQHALLGGLYSVITPGYIYTNCILKSLTDISGDVRHPQEVFKFDFIQPLVSQQAAQQAQNNLMQTITNGTQPTSGFPTWSTGLPSANPTSTLTSSLSSPLIQ